MKCDNRTDKNITNDNSLAQMGKGALVFAADNTTQGSGGTALHFSYDNGVTWSDDTTPDPLGIHGSVVELKNGSLLVYGRGNDIDGTMAQSMSHDLSHSWTYSASPFPGIHGGQRSSMIRAREGFIVFCSFANVPFDIPCAPSGSRSITGLYCAASSDEGRSFPHRRLVSDDGAGTVLEALDEQLFIMGFSAGEPDGYSVLRQDPESGLFHLISSRMHYRFTAAWLLTPAPCEPASPTDTRVLL
jgi:formylglycine-generating enzyme